MNLGGPVWHASAAPLKFDAGESYLRERAMEALEGVGSALLGEWEEWTGRAYHVRRRLTETEMERAGIAGVVDVRGTPEGYARLSRVYRWANPTVMRIAAAEIQRK